MSVASPNNPNLCPACDGIALGDIQELVPELVVATGQLELNFSMADRRQWRPRPISEESDVAVGRREGCGAERAQRWLGAPTSARSGPPAV